MPCRLCRPCQDGETPFDGRGSPRASKAAGSSAVLCCPPPAWSAMTESSRDRACEFVQRAQVAAGAWLPRSAISQVQTASQLLRSLPPLDTDCERAATARVLAQFGERLQSPRPQAFWPVPRRAEAVRRLIEMACDPTLELTVAAERLGWSRWHLCRVIRAECGCTFWELVHLVRMYRAVTLLVVSYDSVKQIAARVGYRDTGELDRHFHKLLQIPPTTLRKALANIANGWE
jgi:AraC-like DNA-binding protein